MQLSKKEAMEYLMDNVADVTEDIIEIELESITDDKGLIDVKDMTQVLKKLLEKNIRTTEELQSIIGDGFDPNNYTLNINEIEPKEEREKLQNAITMPILITLMTFFPALIIGKLFGVNSKFMLITVFMVNIIYIMYSVYKTIIYRTTK